ncbi:MAG: Crp/Fnr family transcriptional regulator [Muribaculaceae bacterium]|nr:Crp/Fnr family transcriptional regulator [Muribaculaceae bacterium]
MAQFNSYIDLLNLTAATEFCRENGTLCHYRKGECFVQQGSIARHAALVVSGYFKIATLNDSGDEAVVNFAFPGQFITDFHSSLRGEPSQFSIIAGTDCEIMRVPLKTFKESLSPSLLDEYKALFNMVFMRLLNLYRKSPRQRYVEMCEKYPRILETVTLKDLSSFLLITPNHLSRIRRELANNQETNSQK